MAAAAASAKAKQGAAAGSTLERREALMTLRSGCRLHAAAGRGSDFGITPAGRGIVAEGACCCACP